MQSDLYLVCFQSSFETNISLFTSARIWWRRACMNNSAGSQTSTSWLLQSSHWRQSGMWHNLSQYIACKGSSLVRKRVLGPNNLHLAHLIAPLEIPLRKKGAFQGYKSSSVILDSFLIKLYLLLPCLPWDIAFAMREYFHLDLDCPASSGSENAQDQLMQPKNVAVQWILSPMYYPWCWSWQFR